MTGQRILIALLVANLFATLLVYRGMEVLVERVDRLQCERAVAAAGTGQPSGVAQPSLGTDAQRAVPTLSDPASPVEEERNLSAQAPADVVATDMDDIGVIKTRFESQSGDAAWTAQIQQALQNVTNTSADYVGITQDIVECKESICKLVLGYTDQAVFDAFVDGLTMALKDELAATLYFDETSTLGGNSTVDVYLVREL